MKPQIFDLSSKEGSQDNKTNPFKVEVRKYLEVDFQKDAHVPNPCSSLIKEESFHHSLIRTHITMDSQASGNNQPFPLRIPKIN